MTASPISLSDEPPEAGAASLLRHIDRYPCDSRGARPAEPARIEIFHGIEVAHRRCPDDETFVLHGENDSEIWLSTPRGSSDALTAVKSMRRR